MKRIFAPWLVLLTCALSGGAAAQTSSDPIATSGALPAVGAPIESAMRRAGSTNLDLRKLPKTAPRKQERPEREEPDPNPVELPGSPSINAPVGSPGPTVQAPAPITNFDGLDFANWGAGHPPDTNGDVGPTYYIQTINTSIGIFRKSDQVRVAAFTFNTFMSQGNFGNLCDTNNFGDPVVLYDSFEDRWVITDFAFTLDGSGNVVNPPGVFQCFAVSKSGDPVTGGWNFYSISIAGGLDDYPKFGIWPDGIYMSANVFGYPAGAAFQNPRVYALNKAQMYAGNSTVQIVSFNAPSADFTLLPSNARLQTGTPPTGTPNYFVSTWEFLNALTVYKFHVDWNRISQSTFTGPDTPLAATSWPNASVPNAPSLNGNALDVLQFRAMMQNQYTNIGGVESLWTAHTVRRANTSGFAASRWYQVNVTGSVVAANLPQAATWDPDGANVLYRFVPSLAVDRAGDMALGYSTSSSTTKPAIAYAGRLAADPVNTFSQTEQILIQGTGTQSGNCGSSSCIRWGDYSAMTLDPDGCTFWYTSQYYAVDGLNHQTRIGSFAYPSCVPLGAGGTISGTVTASAGGAPLNGASVTLGSRSTTTDASGFYSFAALPAGTYPTLSASYPGCSTSTDYSITVSDGNTTTEDFALNAAPLSACVTDTTQSDFQQGVQTNVDLASSPGDIVLGKPSLDQSNETVGTSGVGITTTTWGGQTFTPAVSGLLTGADVNLFCSGCTGTTPNLTLSVRATSAGLPTGADLASATVTGFSSGAAVFYSATFATPATLTAGTQYALVIRPVANPSPGTYALTRSGTSTAGASVYAGGTRVSGATSGTVWSIPLTGGVSTDAGFRTRMDSGYLSSGDQISEAFDSNPAAGFSSAWNTLSWNATTPANTALQFQAAASNSASGPFNFVGSDGTAATFFTSSGASLSQFNGQRYLKYRAYLSTTDATVTPTLNDVTVCFTDPCIPPPAPTITPGGPTTFCAGGSVTLTSSSASGNQWFQDGNPIGGATSQTYSAIASGDYTAEMTNSNSCMSAASTAVTVTVTPNPATPTITPEGPTTFFAGGSVTLDSSSTTGNQWYLNGNAIGGATGQQYVATASGNYTVTVTSSGCSSGSSAATTVTVNNPPDLSITKTDGVTSVHPGGSTTYTITASNAGPSDATGATVADTLPAALTCSWTCSGSGGGTCTAAGTGNINDTVNLPNGASVSYVASCSVSGAASGTLSNTATVAEPPGATDPVPGNNSATDTDSIVAQADLALTLDDHRNHVEIGNSLNYIIDVTNVNGPNTVTATVTDALPAGLIDGSWVCIPFGGATCANGFGNTLTDSVTLPVGSEAAYVYSATVVTGDANDQLVDTASAVVTNGIDPTPGNNSATDTDIVSIFIDGFEGTPVMRPSDVGNGTDYVTATLRIDATLLNALTIMPTAVANGRGADGKKLFTLEFARFGSDVVLRAVTTDGLGYSERSSWQVIDVSQRLLAFAWQSASNGASNGYLKLDQTGGVPLLSGRGDPDRLTQLLVTIENSTPWLVVITQ